ncbi:hypothetical protein, partial [Aquifex sp.]
RGFKSPRAYHSSMNVFVSLETWDIDDTLMLLFLLHYHELGKINLIGIEVDSGTLEQNNFVKFILDRVGSDIPIFSRNLVSSSREEIPNYYYEFFEGLERKKISLTERSEVFDYLKNKSFKVLVGGSLNFVNELVKRRIFPEEVVVQGGFAGKNVTGKRNPKFGDLNFKATFNFNKDVKATLEFLEIQKEVAFPLYLVSKNVNHLITLRLEDIPEVKPKTEAQKLYMEILQKYLSEIRKEKNLHDVYAAIALFDKGLFKWEEVKPLFRPGKRHPEWGSEKGKTNVFITVDGDRERIKRVASFKEELK